MSGFAACCYSGLVWFIISKQSRNWDEAATLQNRKFSRLTGKLQNKLGGIFYLSACLYQHSFFSVIFLYLTFPLFSPHLSWGVRKLWKSMWKLGKPSMSRAKVANGRELAGALGCGAGQWAENKPVPVRLLWWNWDHWWNWGCYCQRAGSGISDKGRCEVLLDVLCEIRRTAELHVVPESGMSILIFGRQMRRRALAIQCWPCCSCLFEISKGDKPVDSLPP